MISYRDLPGAVSERALDEHLKLYKGYIEMLERSDQGQIFSSKPIKPLLDHPYSTIVKSQSYAVSGADLHELFFSGLSLTPGRPSDRFLMLVNAHYGTLKDLYKAVKEVAMVCRGWAVLAFRRSDGELRIFGMNSHDEGACFGYEPLLVLDVWEHAYWMDWGTNKLGYLEAIEKYIDWSIVSSRIK